MTNETKTELEADYMLDVCAKMIRQFRDKNVAYGDSFGKTVQKYGPISALTRMSDKWNRIENLLLDGENNVKDERLEDTLVDMACYCLMTLYELETLGLKCLNENSPMRDVERTKDIERVTWKVWDGWIGNHDARIEDATCSKCGYIHPTVHGSLSKLADHCPSCGSKMLIVDFNVKPTKDEPMTMDEIMNPNTQKKRLKRKYSS